MEACPLGRGEYFVEAEVEVDDGDERVEEEEEGCTSNLVALSPVIVESFGRTRLMVALFEAASSMPKRESFQRTS